jgi:exosortase J
MKLDPSLEVVLPDDAKALSPASEQPEPGADFNRKIRPAILVWCGIAVLVILGCLGIYREIVALWATWTTDPLRSIGLLIPPASIVLTLSVWRRAKWVLRGSWWGLLAIVLSFFLSILRQKMTLYGIFGHATVTIIPTALPVYLYGSGIVLLFAGPRVWRKAWFPLGLLLLSQPVPILSAGLIDYPLQSLSARVARSFATLIHFAPTTPQLRLMFSPDFGMFIAPGCDGIRGAVTMGYVALVLGYLKRVSFRRWAGYVAGAILLGYLFNFIRLCVLVLYYRIALGHSALENAAKWADYCIGSCLFLFATCLFLWIARRKEKDSTDDEVTGGESAEDVTRFSGLFQKLGAFAIITVIVVFQPSSPLLGAGESAATRTALSGLMPKQVGAYQLTRTWYEQQDGITEVESGSYSAPESDEVILGVWVAGLSHIHDANVCKRVRGLQADSLSYKPFVTARGQSVDFNTGFYSDGITDSIVLNAMCSPVSCSQLRRLNPMSQIGFFFLEPQMSKIAGRGHPVSIMVQIERLHTSAPKEVSYGLLSSEAEKFFAGFDPTALSNAFQ